MSGAMSALITTRPPSPTHERMLSSVSDSTARPHAERTDAELQSIVSTAQAEIDQRKAERLQLQEERREFEATRKRLAETEAELDKRAAKQQRQTGHTNSENSTSNHQLTVLAVLPASASGDVVSFKSLVAQLANNPMLSISVKRGIYELGEEYRVQDKASLSEQDKASFCRKLVQLVSAERIEQAMLAIRAAESAENSASQKRKDCAEPAADSEDSTSNHQDQDQDGVAAPATADNPLQTIAAHTTTPRTALSTVAATTLAQPVAAVAAAAHLQPTAEPSAAVTQPAAAQPAGMDIDALAGAPGVVPVQTTTAAAAAPTVHDLTESARVTPLASGNVLSFKDLVAQLAKDPTLSSSVKRQIYELGEAYRVQDKASFFGKLKELVGKELIKRALLALRAASSVTDAAAVSCSSSHAAPLAATKPVRQKQKRKASHVLVGPDVLLKEHVECARVDGTTVVRATNGGASSYAIEEMD